MAKKHVNLKEETILIDGSPGFIRANLVLCLLRELKSGTIANFDNMNDFYDINHNELRLLDYEEVKNSYSGFSSLGSRSGNSIS